MIDLYNQELLERIKNELFLGFQRSLNIAFLHQRTFSEFKYKFKGKTVVLVGAGPTLNYYEPIKDAIHIGVNRTFLYEKIKFDYLFAIDKMGLETQDNSYTDLFLNYQGNNCIKFIGDQNCGAELQIPEGKLNPSIKRYKTTANFIPSRFVLDIESEPLGNFASVAFQAMQFILYGNPDKIYLVGMDTNVSIAGHFIGNKANLSNNQLFDSTLKCINIWKELKEFKNIHYPDTKIISVNPVGLKGIFNDTYTNNYKDTEDKKIADKTFDEFYSEPMKKYLELNDFDNTFEKIKEQLKNKRIIIYGTGRLFQYIQKNYDLKEFNILALTDRKYVTSDNEFLGYKTITINKINALNPDYIVIAAQEYEKIEENLNKEFKNIKILPLVKKKA